jgi:hypothetical protein
MASRSARYTAALAVVLTGLIAARASAAVTEQSRNVAIVLGEGTASAGALQTSGSVAGSPADSFEQFTFTDLEQAEIEPGVLAQYDTVVLNQVFTSSLSGAQEQALSSFVTAGGKLIIHDADGTEGNDYSWLPVPAQTGVSCENCGNTDGEARIVENNTLVSSDPSSPDYVDVEEFPGNSDAVGDANVLVTSDPRWDRDILATNDQNIEGVVDGYASDGGLIIYNGFDTDDIGTAFPSGNDWLDKLWYNELAQQWNPDNLPHANPVVGPGGHCGYHTVTVGVVTVCAESVSGTASDLTATGKVVLDQGVGVGNGPVTIDEETGVVSTATPAPITLLRGSGAVSLGSAAFTIECAGTTDPTSGKTGLAKVSLTAASLGALGTLRVGGLPFSLPSSGNISLYLDSSQGGGLVGAGSVSLPILGDLNPSGSLSLGLYAGSHNPVVALGGGVQLGDVDLAPGWKFLGLKLSYQEPTDTWTASGGLQAPIGSLQASGSLLGGKLNSLNVDIGGQNVPLGDSGFFFTDFGGGFDGLAKGPLSISASTAGFWGAPDSPVEPFYLDNVSLTVSLAGSVSLDGAVSMILKDDSPLSGELHLKIGLKPFSAVGSASLKGSLPGVELEAQGGAGFTTKHFTATEGGTVKMYGLEGKGEVVVSDKGLGASGTFCGPFHAYCQTLAFAGSWKQLAKFDLPAVLGADPSKLITVPGVTARAAAEASAKIHVPAHRRLLLIAVTGTSTATGLELRSPSGAKYAPGHSARSVVFSAQPQFNLVTISVDAPAGGTWSLEGAAKPEQVAAETVGQLELISASRLSGGGSRSHPLKTNASVALSWRSSGLPAGVRLTLTRRSTPHEEGVTIARGLGASGTYRVPVSKLAPGRNYLALSATVNGVPFQQVTPAGQIWRVSPPPRHRKAGKGKR